MKQVIITTTNCIEGRSTKSYLGIVTTNLVIGTNILSDMVASFSDIFGGNSGTYRRQLNQLYDQAISDLNKKALLKGADAIVGTRLDFDEISGRGKEMFMVCVSGTAVKLDGEPSLCTEDECVSEEEITSAIILERLKEEPAPIEKDWEQILALNSTLFAEQLFLNRDKVFSSSNYSSYRDKFDEFFARYFDALPNDIKKELSYKYVMEQPGFCVERILSNGLFSPKHILSLLENDKCNYSTILKLLEAKKDYYDKNDLESMEQIVMKLSENSEVGPYRKEVRECKMNCVKQE